MATALEDLLRQLDETGLPVPRQQPIPPTNQTPIAAPPIPPPIPRPRPPQVGDLPPLRGTTQEATGGGGLGELLKAIDETPVGLENRPTGAIAPESGMGGPPESNALPAPAGELPPMQEQGLIQTYLSGIGRGFNQAQQAGPLFKLATGMDVTDPQAVAEEFSEQVRQAQAYPYDPDILDFGREWNDPTNDNLWSNIKILSRHPKFLAEVLGESVGSSVPGVGLGAVGRIAGGQLGGAAGIGAGSTLVEFGSALAQVMHDEYDIDLADPDQVAGFFNNKEAVAKAREFALKRGVSVGATDALFGLIAPKIVRTFNTKLGRTVEGVAGVEATRIGKITGAAGGVAAEATGGGLGEVLAQLSTVGTVDMRDVVLEVVGEAAGGGVPELATQLLFARDKKAQTSLATPTPEEIAALGGAPEPTPILTPEQAAQEGRTLYGFDVGRGETRVYTNYEEAERQAATEGVRNGRLIAVRPEEVDATAPKIDVDEVIALPRVARNSLLLADVNQNQDLHKQLDIVEGSQFGSTKYEAARRQAQELLNIGQVRSFPKAIRPNAGVFRGDSRARQIDFKQVAYADLHADKFSSSPSSVVISPGITNKTGWTQDIDLLKLQPGQLLPTTASIQGIATKWGEDTAKQLAIEGGSTPQAIEAMLNYLRDDGTQPATVKAGDLYDLMRTGDLKFKPDARVFSVGGYVPSNAEAVAAVKAALVERPNTSETRLLLPEKQAGHILPWANIVRAEDKEATVSMTQGPGDVKFDQMPRNLQEVLTASMALMEKVIKDNKLPYSIKVLPYTAKTRPDRANYWGHHLPAMGYSEIAINVGDALGISWETDTGRIWRTLAHEFGHFIAMTGFMEMKPEMRTRILAAYRRFLLTTESFSGDPMVRAGMFGRQRTGDPQYHWSFDEWFADQVARWASTGRKPLGFAARYMRPLGRLLLKVLKRFSAADPTNLMRAEPEVESFLNTVLGGNVRSEWATTIQRVHNAATQLQNERDNNYDIGPMSPMTVATATIRDVAKELDLQKIDAMAKQLGVNIPPLKSVFAQVDRFNWFYEWALSLPQVADRNLHIPELQAYRELVQLGQLEQSNITTVAHTRLQEWRKLGGAQAEALGQMLFEVTQMDHNPTQVELTNLIAKYKLSGAAVRLYGTIRNDFKAALDRYTVLLTEDANKITDPLVRAAKLREINVTYRNLLSKPYFPMTRYGRWTLTVRNQTQLEHFETFETKVEMMSAYKRARATYPPGSGYTVQTGTLREDVVPYLGVPPQVLDLIQSTLNLNPTQQAAFEQLRYQLAPSQSFKKKFLQRKGISGYSEDAQRNYAHYMFHHSKHFMRLKYAGLLREQINNLFASKNLRGDFAHKLTEIGNFMKHHVEEVLNPKKDMAALRSAAAVWYLGFVPQSAILNLTQIGFATGPFLASKFGDLKTLNALRKSVLSVSTFYRKGTIQQSTDPELRALGEAMDEGIIDESQAAELAALSEGNSLLAGVPGQNVRRAWMGFANLSMGMFQQAEQFNRRVTFRAGWRLAMDNQAAPWLNTLRTKHALQYQRLLSRGWSQTEATAFLAGKDAVLSTQFEYARYARPRFMQGRAGTLFMFFLFTQNMTFMLWNNKGTIPRYMLGMLLIGGLMGLPGMEDAAEIIKAIAGKFGKDFDVEREARKIIVEVLGEDFPPDMVLRGVSRDSFGIPQLMDMAGITEFPQIDMSRQLGAGRILPINPAFLIGSPGLSAERATSEAIQNVGGAAFGIGFNLYQAVRDQSTPWNDLKRWERAMPRSVRNAFRTRRILKEGAETDRSGAVIAPFDYQDPTHVAEAAALFMGFQPTRITRAWDRRIAQIEINTFWDTRRAMVFNLYSHALMRKDKEMLGEAKAALRRFNEEVPYASKKITQDSIRRSLEQRATLRARREAGVAERRGEASVVQELERLYPESSVRRTRELEKSR